MLPLHPLIVQCSRSARRFDSIGRTLARFACRQSWQRFVSFLRGFGGMGKSRCRQTMAVARGSGKQYCWTEAILHCFARDESPGRCKNQVSRPRLRRLPRISGQRWEVGGGRCSQLRCLSACLAIRYRDIGTVRAQRRLQLDLSTVLCRRPLPERGGRWCRNITGTFLTTSGSLKTLLTSCRYYVGPGDALSGSHFSSDEAGIIISVAA